MKLLYSDKDCLYVLPELGAVHLTVGDNFLDEVYVDAILALNLPSEVLNGPENVLEDGPVETSFEIVKPKPTKGKS